MALGLIALAATAAAAEVAGARPIEELELGELLGTVGAASMWEEDLMLAPAAVTVLDRERIRRSGARSVPELLRGLPGVQVIQSVPGDAQVSVRGLGILEDNAVLVLLDGVVLNRRADGEIDWGAVPVAVGDLARVEVVRGPVGALYGANAFTGVISLSTREPGLEGGYGGAQVGLDEAGGLSRELNLGAGGRGERLRWDLSAVYGEDGTYAEGPAPAGAAPQPGGGQPPARRAAARATLRRDAGRGELTLELGGSASEQSGLDPLIIVPSLQRQLSAYAEGELAWGEPDGALSAALFTRATYSQLAAEVGDYRGFSYDGTLDDGAALGLRAGWRPSERLRLGGGGELGGFYTRAPYLSATLDGRVFGAASAYATGDLDASRWLRLSAGVRHDRKPVILAPQTAYRLSALAHGEALSARLSASSAYRQPSYIELSYHMLEEGDDTTPVEHRALPSPRLKNVELGLIAVPGPAVSIRPTAYLESAEGLLERVATGSGRSSYVPDAVVHHIAGGELELAFSPSEAVELLAAAGASRWLNDDENIGLTEGGADHLPGLSASLSLDGDLPGGRLYYGADFTWLDARDYELLLGAPEVVQYGAQIPAHWRPRLRGGALLSRRMPLWLSLSAEGAIGLEGPESPLPGAGAIGARGFAELRYDPGSGSSL